MPGTEEQQSLKRHKVCAGLPPGPRGITGRQGRGEGRVLWIAQLPKALQVLFILLASLGGPLPG